MSKYFEKYLSEIIAAAAMLIALVATITSIIQTIDNKEHNILSVKPQLEIVTRSTKEINPEFSYTFTIAIENAGIGPALISDVEVFFQSEKIESEDQLLKIFSDNFENKLKRFSPSITRQFVDWHKTTLKPSIERNLIELTIQPLPQTVSDKNKPYLYNVVYNEITDFFNNFRIKVSYESLYGIEDITTK